MIREFTLRELARATTDVIRVPCGQVGPGQEDFVLLQEEEMVTLESFPELMMRIEEGLPIEVFLINGSSNRLVLRPASGGTIVSVTEQTSYVSGEGREVVIYPNPLEIPLSYL